MSKLSKRLIKKLHQREAEINRLKGMYDCSIGKPYQSDDRDYMEGYGHQYEMEQKQLYNTLYEKGCLYELLKESGEYDE